MNRRNTVGVKVGHVQIGGGAPVVVQSMTNTDTADIEGTVQQVYELARAGSELVRITVDREESAAAVAHIREKLDARDCNVPLMGISILTGINCWSLIPTAPRRWANTASTQVMWAVAPSATRNLRK